MGGAPWAPQKDVEDCRGSSWEGQEHGALQLAWRLPAPVRAPIPRFPRPPPHPLSESMNNPMQGNVDNPPDVRERNEDNPPSMEHLGGEQEGTLPAPPIAETLSQDSERINQTLGPPPQQPTGEQGRGKMR